MTYDLKNVFYLDTAFDLAGSTGANTETGITMDISAYIDPVATLILLLLIELAELD